MTRNAKRSSGAIVDAINDAVAALTEVVRSVRGTTSGRRPSDVRSRAEAVGREVEQGARGVSADVRHAGRNLRAHFLNAWKALTTHHGADVEGKPASRRRRATTAGRPRRK